MNPYDFVRLDVSRDPRAISDDERREIAATSLDRLSPAMGAITCTLTALTPIFIPNTADLQRRRERFEADPPKPIGFAHNAAGRPIIPGSSLKGLLRSVIETVGPGCWRLFTGTYGQGVDYRNMLPQSYRPCSSRDSLCVACRLFGAFEGATQVGKVSFSDAVCHDPIAHAPIFTPILENPKPRHSAWYLDQTGRQVAGRKYYFHFYPPAAADLPDHLEYTSDRQSYRNSYIQPLGPGSRFSFTVSFSNLTTNELASLLYAIVLERADWDHGRDLRHKLGYGKPIGMGSVEALPTYIRLIRPGQRYARDGNGTTGADGEALRAFFNHYIRPRFVDADSVTLADLRDIWAWPPAEGVEYAYPSRDWFADNSAARLARAHRSI